MMPGEKGELVCHRVTSGSLWRSLVENVPGQRIGGQGGGGAGEVARDKTFLNHQPQDTERDKHAGYRYRNPFIDGRGRRKLPDRVDACSFASMLPDR